VTNSSDKQPNDAGIENADMTPQQRPAILRRTRTPYNIADVQRRLDAPQRERFTALAQRHGETRLADAAERFPSLTGDDETGSAFAEQLEAAMLLPHQLAEARFVSAGDTATFMAVHVAGDRLGKFRAVADRAVAEYFRHFGAQADRPSAHPVGFTVESSTSTGETPDTRAYAIMARYPFERTPVANQADLNALVHKESRQRMCDLRLKGGFCDGAMWSNSVLLPIARADVIVLVAVCFDCWKTYRERHGISGGEITDPDDTVD
jgi:hypothetical protein